MKKSSRVLPRSCRAPQPAHHRQRAVGMLADFKRIGASSIPEFDVCVIGGGIAGLTLAHALRDVPARICVLEAGGASITAAGQELFDADCVGFPYTGHTLGRFRALG